MRQASNIHYFVGLTAISLLVGSCSVDRNTTKITAPQKVAAMQQYSDKNTSSPAPEIAKPQPPKADLIAVGVMANVRSDRAVKVDGMKTLDRIIANNSFATPIEGKGGKLVVVYITLKNTGNESGNMAWSGFRLEDKEGRKYDEIDDFMTKSIWLKEQGLDRDNEQIFPGGTTQTAKIFRVANDASNLKLSVNLTTFKLSSEDRNIQIYSDEGNGKSNSERSNENRNQSNDAKLNGNNSSVSLSSDKSTPDTAVVNHYKSIDNRELDASWNNLSPNFKGSNLAKGFNEYIEWWNSVEKVYIGDARVIKSSETNSVVKVDLSYKLRSGRIMDDKKKYIYLVWIDGKWLIDGKSETYNN